MSFDENLAARVRGVLGAEAGWTEKKMFGGLVLLLDAGIAVGVFHDGLLVRTRLADRADWLAEPGVREFAFGGRTMTSFLFVAGSQCEADAQLRRWVARGVASRRAAGTG